MRHCHMRHTVYGDNNTERTPYMIRHCHMRHVTYGDNNAECATIYDDYTKHSIYARSYMMIILNAAYMLDIYDDYTKHSIQLSLSRLFRVKQLSLHIEVVSFLYGGKVVDMSNDNGDVYIVFMVINLHLNIKNDIYKYQKN